MIFGAVQGFEGKLGEPCFDVSAGSGTCTGEYVTPVSLAVDEQFLLSQFDECLVYRGIAVGVKLHGLAYDAGHLIDIRIGAS